MRKIHAAALLLAGLFAAAPAKAQAPAQDFYRGKTISFIIGYGPGGGVDTASRLIIRHLFRFIPGKPDITPQNMEGAGGVISGNYLGARASKDGLTIGLPGRSWFVEGIEYGFPLRTVLGYNSSARSLLALEQGEVGAYYTPEDSFTKRPDLIEKKVVVPVMQSKRIVPGLAVVADVVPKKDHAVLGLFNAYDDTGLMVVAPPGVPSDRLEILRKAFIEMCNDADFRKDAATAGEPVGAPIPGPELEKVMANLAAAATPEVVSEYRRLGQAK